MTKTTTLIIAITAMLTACTAGGKQDAEKPLVAVSIEPQRYFVEQIAGDKVEVKTLVPKGAAPETYDLTPNQIVTLGQCQAYFVMGHLAFERQWVDSYSSQHPHTSIVDMSKGVDPIVADTPHIGHQKEDIPGLFVEPHTWMSVRNALTIANNVCEGLCVTDPENKAYYEQRLDSLDKRLHRLDKRIRTTLATADSTFLIYHPALTYFARDYGLTQISIESDGKEPSPRQMKTIIDKAAAKGINVLFIQPEFDRRTAETLVKSTRTRLVTVNPLAYDWEKEMTAAADALAGNERKDR